MPTEELRIQIDTPYVGDGSAEVTVSGGLSIAGWALAREGVAGIDVAVDGNLVGSAYHGLPRPDVADAFPDWPNARDSGFTTLVHRHRLPAGRHGIELILRDKTGRRLLREFSVVASPQAISRKISQAEIDLQIQILSSSGWYPTFSLVLLVDPGTDALDRTRATLRSLRDQAYRGWHAYVVFHHRGLGADVLSRQLVDGLSNVTALRAAQSRRHHNPNALFDSLLAGFDDISEQVEILGAGEEKTLDQFLGRRSRSALLGILSAGDELTPNALLEFAVTSGLNPDAELLYSDELRISPSSNSLEPFLKPQWSPDLLLSTNYIGRFWCASRELLERLRATLGDLLRLGDYDLVLRATEAAAAIRHVPKVLCERSQKPVAADFAGRRALERAIARRGIAGEIHAGCVAGTYRLQRKLANPGRVSIIIPTRASRGLIRKCLDTLRDCTAYRNFEIIIIENVPQSEGNWKQWLRDNADVVIETEEPFNWSRFMNLAAAAASGEFLLFLNDDIEIVEPNWLNALIEHGQRSEVGVVGPLLLYPDRTVQHAGIFLTNRPRYGGGTHPFRHAAQDSPGYFGLTLTQRNVIAVTGACLLTRRDVFERLGRFNESHRIINNDVDYCLRAWRSGLATVFTPYSRLIHHERGSRNELGEDYDSVAFASEWRTIFADGDPYHHPQLSKEFDDFVPEPEPVRAIYTGGPQISQDAIRNILIVKLDHIGDCVTAFPAIRRLKQNFPHAALRVLAGHFTAAVWPLAEVVDEVIEFEFFHARAGQGLREVAEAELVSLRHRLEPFRFDLAIDLRRHTDTRLILRYTSARWLAGFDFQGGFPWLDIAVEWGGDRELQHKRSSAGDDLVVLVEAIIAHCDPNRPTITPPADVFLPLPRAMQDRLFSRPVICVHPTAGNVMKQWPLEYFVELIDLLIERQQVNVALIGGRGDKEIAVHILKSVIYRNAVTDLTGELALSDLPKLLLRCVLFVGNDSGPKHIAAGLGVPTVGIHSGNVDAHEWGPAGPHAVALRRDVDCGPCYLLNPADCRRDLACLTGLRPREVYNFCQRLMTIGLGRRRRQSRQMGAA